MIKLQGGSVAELSGTVIWRKQQCLESGITDCLERLEEG